MKQLLGWMHRKFRQNSKEPFKDLVIGHPCSCLSGQQSVGNNQEYHPRPSYSSKCSRQPQRDCSVRVSFAGLEAAKVEGEFYEEEPSSAFSDLFHGFLAIGTLGSDPVTGCPATPTFAASLENITEKETNKVTENDLKLINEQLEKVLCNEAREDGGNDSSGRSSHVSTITLSGKQMEGADGNEKGTATAPYCPLQDYLFGSSVELPGTPPQVTKKEHRTSLGELFQRAKMAEENSTVKNEREEKQTGKEVDKSAVNLMKKMLKPRILQNSKSTATVSASDSGSAENKLPHKILQMFQRKIHPEGSTSTKKSKKSNKCEIKNKNPHSGDNKNGDRRISDEDIIIIPRKSFFKERIRRFKSHQNPPQFALTSNDLNGNRECWIKTDADYLVLEL